MKLSANLGFLWPDLPLCERIEAAARAGFKAVELHWPYDVPAQDVRHAARQAKLPILALNSSRGDAAAGEFGLACLPGREAEFTDSLTQAFDYAREIGAGAVHVMAGKPGDVASSVWTPLLIENLRLASRMANGLTVLIEPLNTTDNPGYAYATLAQADAIREAVGSEALCLMFDAYHEAMGGNDTVASWRRYRGVIGHIQIAGVPGRNEPEPGQAPITALIAALRQDGYTGWIGCEYRPRGDTDSGLDWRQFLGLGNTG